MDDDADLRRDFHDAVNMTAGQLRDWLGTEESRSVGQKDQGGESTGHESGRRIVDVLGTKVADLDEADHDQMRRTVS